MFVNYFRFVQNHINLIMIKKSHIGIALLLAGFAFSFQSCKRGENDPMISFKSRTARLKGDWKLSSKSAILTNASNTGSTSLATVTVNGVYEGGTENVLTNTNGTLTTVVRKYDFSITFDETGRYTYTVNIFRPTGNQNSPYQNFVYTTTGVWAWMDQGKDKLGLSLSNDFQPDIPDTLDPQTLLPYNVNGSYNIDRLASDELVLKRIGQFTTTIDTVVTNTTFDGTFTFGR